MRHRAGAAIALRIYFTGAQEDAVLEVIRKEPLHPQQRMHAHTPVLADEKDGGRLVRVYRRRVRDLFSGPRLENNVSILRSCSRVSS